MSRQPAPRNWPQFITSTIQKYTSGKPEDDLLVAAFRYVSPRIDEHLSGEAKTDEAPTLEQVVEKLD